MNTMYVLIDTDFDLDLARPNIAHYHEALVELDLEPEVDLSYFNSDLHTVRSSPLLSAKLENTHK